jgi:hypothetical protein
LEVFGVKLSELRELKVGLKTPHHLIIGEGLGLSELEARLSPEWVCHTPSLKLPPTRLKRAHFPRSLHQRCKRFLCKL